MKSFNWIPEAGEKVAILRQRKVFKGHVGIAEIEVALIDRSSAPANKDLVVNDESVIRLFPESLNSRFRINAEYLLNQCMV